ncbi:uncharacterized protein LOC135198744 [Macrobrachium nipponense]|uniref:uncharacterized protein LOC135198744 n=1 Tax=Macrobrachium nipponense TaxID=159736 RepID=UPI0030C86B72
MRIVSILALVGVVTAQQLPSSSYRAPTGQFTNGFGPVNGRVNGNGAPPSRSYGAPNGRFGSGGEIGELTESIPGGGVPGQDFPILASVPDTGFSCDAQNVPGYYADTAREAGCQVFHICQDRPTGQRQQDSFLCPNGTIFNQQYLVCDWWYNFDCSSAESFYSVNELIGIDANNGGYSNGNGNRRVGNGNGRVDNGNGRVGNGNRGYGGGNGGRNGNGRLNAIRQPSNSYGAPL